MRWRSWAIGAGLALVSLAVALTVARSGGAPARPAALPVRETPAPKGSPAPLAPASVRDIFRFGDELADRARPVPKLIEVPAPASVTPTPPSGPKLVGLVRRSGRLLAAVAFEGEVDLLGPGESAAGITVVSVDEDGARIRRADGSETTLVLP